MDGNEKLNILIDAFGKLEESRKDHIRELCRKLADIHYPESVIEQVIVNESFTPRSMKPNK